MVVLSDDYVLHFDYFILEFLNVTILIDSVDNERTAEPQNCILNTDEKKRGRITTGYFRSKKDLSRPLYSQPLAGWVLSARSIINALLS